MHHEVLNASRAGEERFLPTGVTCHLSRSRYHAYRSYQLRGLPFLGRLLDVLNRLVEFLLEFLVIVADAVQVRTRTGYTLDHPAGFLNVLVTQPVQRQLRCMEGNSVATVRG